jgi:hypothetical protein
MDTESIMPSGRLKKEGKATARSPIRKDIDEAISQSVVLSQFLCSTS